MLIITASVLLWAVIAALRPLPGRDVWIATGSPDSAYTRIAEVQQTRAASGSG